MNCRIMRLIVFFDLPTQTNKDLKHYRTFRRFLLKNGFIMMQESVYCRLVLNGGSANLVKKQIRDNIPPAGLVEMMLITEKQFADIEYLVGKFKSNIVSSTDRVVNI